MMTMTSAVAAASLIGRLYFGLGLSSHGSEKLFGWFGGKGLSGTGQVMEMVGFRPGALFALAAGLGEMGGGLLTALGLFGPLGPAIMLMVMLVAIASVNLRNGFQAAKNGWEFPGLYAVGAFVFAFIGPGPYSLDALLGISPLIRPEFAVWAVAAAIVLALLNLMGRRPASAPAHN